MSTALAPRTPDDTPQGVSKAFLDQRFRIYLVRFRASFPDPTAVVLLQEVWQRDLSRHPWITDEVYEEAENAVIDSHPSTFMFSFASLLEAARRVNQAKRMADDTARLLADGREWRRRHFQQGNTSDGQTPAR